MKLKSFLTGFAAVALLAAQAAPALAAGYFTPNLPVLAAPNITGAEQLPADTLYAGGAAPQSVAITTSSLATFANGGAPSTATAVSGAVTDNDDKGIITTESLTTANAAAYTLILTDSFITTSSVVLVSVGNGTNTTGGSTLATVTPGAGSATIVIYNRSGSAALNGTLTVAFRVI